MKRIVRKSKKPIPYQLADTNRSLVEIWRRIEEGQFPYTKVEVCRLAEVSPRWVEAIVAAARRST